MANTGGERITNTFRFCHHAIPVLTIMATDRILDATAHLTAAIEGIQEAPPDELAAIQALRPQLLGEVPLTEPTSPQGSAPRPINDEEPVSYGAWKKSKIQHAMMVSTHQQVCHPARALHPSSKTMPTTSCYHLPSCAAPPGQTTHHQNPPCALASTYPPHT